MIILIQPKEILCPGQIYLKTSFRPDLRWNDDHCLRLGNWTQWQPCGTGGLFLVENQGRDQINLIFNVRTPSIVKGNKSLNLVWSKWGSQWWGFGKVFNVLQSPIGRMASRPMRNIETFSSQQMYRYLSLVERKLTEFYHNIERRRYLVWLKWLIFIAFSGQLMVSLVTWVCF